MELLTESQYEDSRVVRHRQVMAAGHVRIQAFFPCPVQVALTE